MKKSGGYFRRISHPHSFSYAVYKNSTQPSTRYSLKFCKNKSAASYIFFILLVRKASLKQITHAVVVFPSVLYRVVAPQFFSLRACGLLPQSVSRNCTHGLSASL